MLKHFHVYNGRALGYCINSVFENERLIVDEKQNNQYPNETQDKEKAFNKCQTIINFV